MNRVLELKGKRFVQAQKTGGGGGPQINAQVIVTKEKITNLMGELQQIINFWHFEERPFRGVLLSVHYNKIVAKSNRINGLLKGASSNMAIVGAKFNEEKNKHIITYLLDMSDLNESLESLSNAKTVIERHFVNGISKILFDDKKLTDSIPFINYDISKSKFRQVVADVSYIEHFKIEKSNSLDTGSIVTIYDTGMPIKDLYKNIGIDILDSRILDNQTAYLDENQIKVLYGKMPYLVSMATEDISLLSKEDFYNNEHRDMMFIPKPTIEPTIGVIDTLFHKEVYFGDWVEYHDMVSDDIPKTQDDYRHGTAVSSIVVDGPTLNPWLDDGCGRFKVRHFGVAVSSKFSSFTIIKQIKEIIANNRDIKVWNLSLGSNQEINDNFISAEGAILDQIQYEYDVIFVIAGTNKHSDLVVKIGSPADSINSMVVNSVTKDGLSPKYTRKGLALSFFAKPDVSYYGGSEEQYIKVCEPYGPALVAGTSFAAPWIARKLSYLIDIIGLNREIAKALIIDAARGWKEAPSPTEVAAFGHGIVPIRIKDILETEDDEIRFVITDISEKWNTYNYHFPIPTTDDTYPFVVRATMCYFPICDRSQGVDYTNTELNLHFGRINDAGKLVEINKDKQNLEDSFGGYILEKEARMRFRKWDNVKYITETIKEKKIPKKAYTNKNWGMEIKTNNRLDPKDGVGLRFGVVVTLKEMFKVNRIDEFIRNCNLAGWIVNTIDISNRIDIHEKINEEIEFE